MRGNQSVDFSSITTPYFLNIGLAKMVIIELNLLIP